MKKISSIIFFISLLVLVSPKGEAQTQDLHLIELSNQIKEEKNQPSEDIYVHLAKTFYLSGEILWFKIYLTDSRVSLPSLVSKVAYVEILDASNKPVSQAKIAIDSGMGLGSISLPTFISSGNYTFIAYTNTQKNRNSLETAFHSVIQIFNINKQSVSGTNNRTEKYHVSVLPESGSIVAGLPSTVAFKIQNQNGNGVDVYGNLVDNNKEVICAIKTRKFGMGRFSFVPKPGAFYQLQLVFPDGEERLYPVGEIAESGFSIQLSEGQNSSILLSVQTNQPGNKQVYLVQHNNKTVQQTYKGILNGGKAIFSLPKSSLQPGINYFSVFNELKAPIGERLYFNHPVQSAEIDLQLPKTDWSIREKIPFSISQKRQEHNYSSNTNLSMAVVLIDSLQDIPGRDIRTYFWLEKHLKGRIENPSFYLDSTDNFIAEITDNLMLVHGWRKIIPKDNVIQNTQSIPEIAGHIITGTLVNIQTKNPASGILVYLSIPGQRFHFSSCRSDQNGRLRFDVKKIFGTENIIFQTNHITDSIYRVELDNPFREQYDTVVNKLISGYQELARSDLLIRTVAAQVETAFQEKNNSTFVMPNFYDTTAFFGKPDISYLLDDYTRFTTMEEVLREYVPEIQVKKSGNKFKVRILNQPYKLFLEERPLILIDGVSVFDENHLIDFDPLKVKKLDIIARKYYHGGISYDGVASFTSYEGDLGAQTLEPSSVVVDYPGLQLQRQYYSPSYDTETERNSRIPDFRNVLLWNPSLRLMNYDNYNSSFYTSDLPGKYVLLIEGLSENGTPIKVLKTITVNK